MKTHATLLVIIWKTFGWQTSGHFKKTSELLNLRALKFSPVNKIHIFQCTGKIFCVEFQRYPLKFHKKYLTHTLKDTIFIKHWNLGAFKFKSSYAFLKCPWRTLSAGTLELFPQIYLHAFNRIWIAIVRSWTWTSFKPLKYSLFHYAVVSSQLFPSILYGFSQNNDSGLNFYMFVVMPFWYLYLYHKEQSGNTIRMQYPSVITATFVYKILTTDSQQNAHKIKIWGAICV